MNPSKKQSAIVARDVGCGFAGSYQIIGLKNVPAVYLFQKSSDKDRIVRIGDWLSEEEVAALCAKQGLEVTIQLKK